MGEIVANNPSEQPKTDSEREKLDTPEELFLSTIDLVAEANINTDELPVIDGARYDFVVVDNDERFTLFTLTKSEKVKSGENKGNYDTDSKDNVVTAMIHEGERSVLGLDEPKLVEMIEEFAKLIDAAITEGEV